MRLVPLCVSLALSAFLLAGPAVGPALAQDKTPLLTLTGHGTVSATPDLAIISIGMVSEAKIASDALQDNNSKTTAVLSALKKAGIKSADLQTSNFSIQPNIVYPNSKSLSRDSGPRIVGYTVNNTLFVRVRDTSLIGTVLDQAIRLGGNSISGPNFDVEDGTPFRADARRQAMQNALAKAQDYAEAAGVKLGRIARIEEQASYSPRPEMAMAMRTVSAPSSVPIESGQVSFSATITVHWEIMQ